MYTTDESDLSSSDNNPPSIRRWTQYDFNSRFTVT